MNASLQSGQKVEHVKLLIDGQWVEIGRAHV